MRRFQRYSPVLRGLASASARGKSSKETNSKRASKSANTLTEKPETTKSSASSTEAKDFVYPRRLVAIGDIRGELKRAFAVLRDCGAVDDNFDWAGGANTTVLQTGNLLGNKTDTVGDDRAVVEKFMRLQKQANSVGGFLEVLYGDTENLRACYGWRTKEHQEAINRDHPIRNWLRERPYIYCDMGSVFIHGWIGAGDELSATNEYWGGLERIVWGTGMTNPQEDCNKILRKFGVDRVVSGLPCIFTEETVAALGDRLLLTGVLDRADIDTKVRYIVMTQEKPDDAVKIEVVQKNLKKSKKK